MPIVQIISFLLFLGAAIAVYFLVKQKPAKTVSDAESETKQIMANAKAEIDQLKARTTEQVNRSAEIFTELEKRFALQIEKSEKTATVFEEKLLVKESQNNAISERLSQENNEVIKLDVEKEHLKNQTVPLLAKVAATSVEYAREELIGNLNQDLELAHETRLSKLMEYTRDHAPAIAKNHLIQVIQRFGAPTSVEKKSLVIPVNRNDTKLRLIGQNAEILTYLEDQLGVDIIFDDSKDGGISVSHFELVKKHIVRETILKLIKDRIINIEKVQKRLEEATAETKAHLQDIGDRIARKLSLEYRNFPPEFKEILGRLKYRTSYGQNILKHCFEVGYFTLMLGNELGLSEEICKIGGFFHDLGKAIDQEDGRPHDVLTKEIMEKFGIFSWEEIHAAWTHHDAIPIETAEALLVKAGDAISAGRPGARQETIEKYLARVMAIQTIANSYDGVNKSYAISGGRELRVIIDPKKLKDEHMAEMAKTIANEIEAKVAYPGRIKINIIRRIQHTRTIKDKSKKAA